MQAANSSDRIKLNGTARGSQTHRLFPYKGNRLIANVLQYIWCEIPELN